MANILIIDDDHSVCKMLSKRLLRYNYNVACAYNLKDGVQEACSGDIDVVFLDLKMPDGNGLDYLPKIKQVYPSPEVIIITGYADSDSAEVAIKNGAWDYLQKPFQIRDLDLIITRALEYRRQKKQAGIASIRHDQIIGSSVKMKLCLAMIGQAARSDVNVMITGETGTGKELVSSAIHQNSVRSNQNLVVVDCAAMPESLVESLLFGHKKGAFTGAVDDKEGLIKLADGGTLFLDEIGELPIPIQVKFLRTLETHAFRPLGRKEEVNSDFRLIAATNRDLDHMVEAGTFRKDLLFRLKSFVIEMPPLRERTEDIKEILKYYIKKFTSRYQVPKKSYTHDYLSTLLQYHWPGNVRELVNVIDRSFSISGHESVLYPFHLPREIRFNQIKTNLDTLPQDTAINSEMLEEIPTIKDLRDSTIAHLEREYFKKLMILAGGDIKIVCAVSGLGRAQLYRVLKKYKIQTK